MELMLVQMSDPAVAPLLEELRQEYQARYGSGDEMLTTRVHEFDPPDGAFIVIVDHDGNTIAGGGIRRHSADTAEVKRMWTAAAHRRQGHASQVLSALEDQASRIGYKRIVLETGPAQAEALAFYPRLGYEPMPHYGSYPLARAFSKTLAASNS